MDNKNNDYQEDKNLAEALGKIGDEYLEKSKKKVLGQVDNFLSYAKYNTSFTLDLIMVGKEGKEEKRMFVIVRVK